MKLISLISYFAIASPHLTNAFEGKLITDDTDIIFDDMSFDASDVKHLMKYDFDNSKKAVQFRDMCSECDQEELISLCLKTIYHLEKDKTIISFKFKYPFESDCVCQPTSDFVRPDILLPSLHKRQNVYTCRGITAEVRNSAGNLSSHTQPPLSLGQGYASINENQYHARVFRGDPKKGPVQFVGLFIGFRLQTLDFSRNIMDGEYKYVSPDTSPRHSEIFRLKSGATNSSKEVYERVN